MAKCWQSHFSSSPKGLNYWPSTEPLSCLALFFYLIKSTLSCYSISLVLWLFPLAWSCSLPRYLFIPHQVMLIAFEASCDALSNWILFHFTDVGRLYCLLLLLLLVLLSTPVSQDKVKLSQLQVYTIRGIVMKQMQLFRHNYMLTLAYLTFTCGWVDTTPHLCGFVENLTVAAVSPSLRPRHLIKRSKFSDEDATRMWNSLPKSRIVSVPVPPTVPTSASRPLSSPPSLRTIPQVRQTLFVHPSLRSNTFSEATVPSAPPWKSGRGWSAKWRDPTLGSVCWLGHSQIAYLTVLIFTSSPVIIV